MSGNRSWKSQDDEDLLHLMEAGFETESVAWALGRSPGAVRTRLAHLHRGMDSPGVDSASSLPLPQASAETGV